MAAEEVKGMERMLGGRKRQKREVKETRVDRWLSLPPSMFFKLLGCSLQCMMAKREKLTA